MIFGRPYSPYYRSRLWHSVSSVCLSVVCDVLYSGETAGPICMKFSGKVWSDHGTTWLHFGSIWVNRAMPITRKRLHRFAWMHHSFCIDRLLWGSTVGHPSDSWASCCCFFVVCMSVYNCRFLSHLSLLSVLLLLLLSLLLLFYFFLNCILVLYATLFAEDRHIL